SRSRSETILGRASHQRRPSSLFWLSSYTGTSDPKARSTTIRCLLRLSVGCVVLPSLLTRIPFEQWGRWASDEDDERDRPETASIGRASCLLRPGNGTVRDGGGP